MAMNHQTELNEQELNTIAGGRITEPKPLPMPEPFPPKIPLPDPFPPIGGPKFPEPLPDPIPDPPIG